MRLFVRAKIFVGTLLFGCAHHRREATGMMVMDGPDGPITVFFESCLICEQTIVTTD